MWGTSVHSSAHVHLSPSAQVGCGGSSLYSNRSTVEASFQQAPLLHSLPGVKIYHPHHPTEEKPLKEGNPLSANFFKFKQ